MESAPQCTDMTACPSCGEGNERRSRFCIHCGNQLPRRKETRLKRRYILFGATGLMLVGAIVYFFMGGFGPGLVGKVNGEGIARKEFSRKLDRLKKFYETRYGKGLFEGEAGKENLNRLKTDLIEEMMMEKILLQEAKKAGYTAVPEEEIEKQVEAIKKKSGLSDVDLGKMIHGSIADLKQELRRDWMIQQFIEKSVLKDVHENRDLIFNQWLTKAKTQARIETYEKLESLPPVKAVCCKGGCGVKERARPLDPKIEKEAKQKALEYYEKKTMKKGAMARVTNFGCHIQVDIIEDGKVVVSLTYKQGEVQEI